MGQLYIYIYIYIYIIPPPCPYKLLYYYSREESLAQATVRHAQTAIESLQDAHIMHQEIEALSVGMGAPSKMCLQRGEE